MDSIVLNTYTQYISAYVLQLNVSAVSINLVKSILVERNYHVIYGGWTVFIALLNDARLSDARISKGTSCQTCTPLTLKLLLDNVNLILILILEF